MQKLLTVFVAILMGVSSMAQLNMDSLWGVWNDHTQPDTNRLKAMKKIAWNGYLFRQPDSAFYFTQVQYDLAESVGNKKWMADALNTQGISFAIRSNIEEALSYYQKSLKIKEEIGDQKGMAASYNNIGLLYQNQGNLEEALNYYQKSLKINKEIEDQKGAAGFYGNIGGVYYHQGNYEEALSYYQKSLKINKEIEDQKGMAHSFGNIGLIYKDQGNFEVALSYYQKSLKIKEELGDQKGLATSYNNIGILYQDQGNLEESLNYYQKCLTINKEIGDQKGMATSYNNIGSIYYAQVTYKEALSYYQKSLKINEEIGDQKGMATSYNNIGSIYKEQANYKESLNYYQKSLKIKKEMGDQKGMAASLGNIGDVYKEQGEFQQALTYLLNAISISKEIKALNLVDDHSKTLYEIYKELGNTDKALELYELHIVTRDTLAKQDAKEAATELRYKSRYETKAKVDSVNSLRIQQLKDKEISRQQAINKQQQVEASKQAQQKYFLYGGLALALLFGGFIFNRYRVTNKQKGIIEEQKEQVEEQKSIVESAHEQLGEKNKEIMDSINYAKRIQSAILPPVKLIKEHLQDSFVLYKPKDIVAGDFYWMEPLEEQVLFAAADCTGHGVPGAMVSVVCNNGLNRSVREYGLTDPGKILDRTRDIVIQEFEKSEEEVKDGMDIALCSLQGNTLAYAGAHNPLWIVRNGAIEIEEIKADKQPIGKYDDPLPYTTHRIELQPGDTFYIFSDGYSDQFGGEKGKKLKSSNFKKLLLSLQQEPMQRQKAILDETFEKWKGNIEQLDDLCVIGVRV